jgi:hypothetical protein
MAPFALNRTTRIKIWVGLFLIVVIMVFLSLEKKQWMVVYRGQQLEVFNTIPQCRKYIKEHSASLTTVTPEPTPSKTPAKLKTRSKRTK